MEDLFHFCTTMQKLLPHQPPHQKLPHAGENPQCIVPLKSPKIYGANSCAFLNKSSAIIHDVARVLKAQTCTRAHPRMQTPDTSRKITAGTSDDFQLLTAEFSHLLAVKSNTAQCQDPSLERLWEVSGKQDEHNFLFCVCMCVCVYVWEWLKPLGNLSCSGPQRGLTAAINTIVHMITGCCNLLRLFFGVFCWFSNILVTLGIDAQQNTSCLLTSAAHKLEPSRWSSTNRCKSRVKQILGMCPQYVFIPQYLGSW